MGDGSHEESFLFLEEECPRLGMQALLRLISIGESVKARLHPRFDPRIGRVFPDGVQPSYPPSSPTSFLPPVALYMLPMHRPPPTVPSRLGLNPEVNRCPLSTSQTSITLSARRCWITTTPLAARWEGRHRVQKWRSLAGLGLCMAQRPNHFCTVCSGWRREGHHCH